MANNLNLTSGSKKLLGSKYSSSKIERLKRALTDIDYYTVEERREFTKIINTIRIIPCYSKINHFEFAIMIKDYFDCKWCSCPNSFFIAVMMNYKAGTEIRLSVLMDEMGVSSINRVEIENKFRGMDAAYPEFITASFTHDLEKIVRKK